MDDKTLFGLVERFHGDQKYGELPYREHLIDVACACHYLFFDNMEDSSEEEYVACILHDILEDTFCTVDDLFDAGVSEKVVHAVLTVTKKEHETREEYLHIIRSYKPRLPWKVKVSDAFSNLEFSIRNGDERRIKKYIDTLNSLYK